MPGKLLRITAVSQLLNIKPPAVYRMVREGLLPGVVVVGKRRIRVDEATLLEWIKVGGEVKTPRQNRGGRSCSDGTRLQNGR